MKSVKFRQYPYSLFTFLQTFGTFFCDQYFFCWFICTTFCLFVLICFRIFFLSPYLLYYGYLYPICLFISPYLRISLLHCKSPYLLIYRLYLSLFADLSVISLLICWFICSIYSYLVYFSVSALLMSILQCFKLFFLFCQNYLYFICWSLLSYTFALTSIYKQVPTRKLIILWQIFVLNRAAFVCRLVTEEQAALLYLSVRPHTCPY